MAALSLQVATLFTAVAAQISPYVPTTLLVPAFTDSSQTGRDAVYMFKPKDSSVELSVLNISSVVESSSPWTTISSKFPFLHELTDTTTFAPTITDNGTILVYAGDCESSTDFAVWSYHPSDDVSHTQSSWAKQSTLLDAPSVQHPGPYFLGGSLSFSATISPTMSDPVLYTYGGMCSSSSPKISGWQSEAAYSNQMLRLSPSASGYSIDRVSVKGPPVAEAGFTFTGLTPAIANRSDIVTQKNSYVLLGGHTQQAFINMSTAAIWSLPEETWTFATIAPPDSGSTELAIKALSRRSMQAEVESRSGHTAVLCGDGKSLAILGGWVGDISQPAEPQLAILNMGEGYRDWKWSIPSQQPDGPGVYGHGAVLLPGNVMMAYGGYKLGGPSNSRRDSVLDMPMFLNLTSMEWSSTYSNPHRPRASLSDSGRGRGKHRPSDGNTTTIGLGVGIGVGAAIIILVVVTCVWWRRRTARQRSAREEAIPALAQDTNRFTHGQGEMIERDELDPSFPWTSHSWYTGGNGPYEQGLRNLGFESLRGDQSSGSGFSGMPLPRKPISRPSRGMYQSASGNRSNPLQNVPGRIHPIYEADEDSEQHQLDPSMSPSPVGDSLAEPQTPISVAPSDPFATPTGAATPAVYPASRASSTPSPENRQRQDPEVQDWMSDLDAADTLLARINPRQGGRVSPTRRASTRSGRSQPSAFDEDTRTVSNLSDSNRSALSIRRSMSGRSHARSLHGFGSSAAATTTLLNPSLVTDTRVGTSGSSSSSNPSFNTARSSFPTLQAEGPSLLLGRASAADDDDDFLPSSPSKTKGRASWLGSLRRVFSSSGNASTSSSSRVDSPTPSSLDHDHEHPSSDYEPRLVGLSGIGGGSLLRRKQGRQAWESGAAAETESQPRRSVEDEWDIERAVEQRLVQVMFTVPRERLRVVNAEVEREEEVAVVVDPELASQRSETSSMALEAPHTPKRNVRLGGETVHLDVGEDTPTRSDSTVVRTAEAVRLERPRTRVLEMVDTIEGKSREGSPAL